MEMERKMWDAYAKQAGGVTFDGKPLPTWDELGEDRQACWRAAAGVCRDEIERLREDLKHSDEVRQSALQSLLEVERENDLLREENCRQRQHIMLLYSAVSTEHEIIRAAALKDGD